MFKGRYNHELFMEYGKWLPYITDMYMNVYDSELGDFRFLPFEGGINDQPYMTMQILHIIQMTYRKVLSEKQKEILQKSKRSR